MKQVQTFAVIAGLLASLPAIGESQQMAGGRDNLEPLPRDLEMELALSALPPHLRGKATVYVLDPTRGFEVARRGTNGFHALVARTGEDAMRGSWPLTHYRNDILYPVSFDRIGAKAQMRVFLDIAEMQSKGTPPENLRKIIQERYRTGYYRLPEGFGVSYMLAPVHRTYTNPDADDNVVTLNLPHVMYYAPNVSNEEFGGDLPSPDSPYPFVILHGPHGLGIQILGVTERAAITQGYAAMLARLCRLNDAWCLPASQGQ